MPLTGVPGAGVLVPPAVVGASPPERLAEVLALSALAEILGAYEALHPLA